MIYLFERENEAMRIETRYLRESQTFEIIWRRADGTSTNERFTGETSFRSRLDEIRSSLEVQHWHTAGVPQLQKDGWHL